MGSVAVAAYGIEKKMEVNRRKHDSMSDAEEGETWDQVILYSLFTMYGITVALQCVVVTLLSIKIKAWSYMYVYVHTWIHRQRLLICLLSLYYH